MCSAWGCGWIGEGGGDGERWNMYARGRWSMIFMYTPLYREDLGGGSGTDARSRGLLEPGFAVRTDGVVLREFGICRGVHVLSNSRGIQTPTGIRTYDLG